MAEILATSLLLPATPLPRKLARLWVVSDVLHNSGAGSQTWRYRHEFEERLPQVFSHWGDVIHSFPGRIKREGIRMQVNTVLDSWENTLVFPSPIIEQFRRAVDSGSQNVFVEPEEPKGSGTEPLSQDNAEGDEDVDGVPLYTSSRPLGLHPPGEESEIERGMSPSAQSLDGKALDSEVLPDYHTHPSLVPPSETPLEGHSKTEGDEDDLDGVPL